VTFQGYGMFLLSFPSLSEIICSQNQHLTLILIPAYFLGFTSTSNFIWPFKIPDNLVDTLNVEEILRPDLKHCQLHFVTLRLSKLNN